MFSLPSLISAQTGPFHLHTTIVCFPRFFSITPLYHDKNTRCVFNESISLSSSSNFLLLKAPQLPIPISHPPAHFPKCYKKTLVFNESISLSSSSSFLLLRGSPSLTVSNPLPAVVVERRRFVTTVEAAEGTS